MQQMERVRDGLARDTELFRKLILRMRCPGGSVRSMIASRIRV